MADQRQPFRFRLPWLPPTATPAPAPAPAPAPRPRQPAAAPPRPAFRPPGVGPAQPPPRLDPPPPPQPPTPPKTTEQGSASKPSTPRKTEPPAKPIAPTGPQTTPPQPTPPKTEPPPKPITPTGPQATQPQPTLPKPTSPPKTEPPSKPITPTGPQTTQPKTEPPPKPTLPPKTEPRSEPIAPSGPQSTPPKTEPPAKPITSNGPQTTALQPAPPKTEPPLPSSVSTPPKPPSPSRSPARPKLSSPSSSSPSTPRDKTLKKPHNSPKRDSPNYPTSPTLSNQSSPSKNASKPDEVVAPKPIQTSPLHQNGEPMEKNLIQVPESETVLEPVAVHRKEMISTSEVGKRAAPSNSSTPNFYPKPGKPNHNHKPAPSQKEIKEDISKLVNKLGAGNGKQTLDGEKQMTVITLAGENRGAAMTLSKESSKKESPIHIHRGYRLNPDENIENSTDGKEGSKTEEETATKACINSNVQGINNSLLFNGSVSTMNPGVRYIRGQDMAESSNGGRVDEEGTYETRKAEVSRIQSDMLAYAPNVRRRCLRGLLMESSDSDTEKPRRHGCYYDRKEKEKGKDGDVDVL